MKKSVLSQGSWFILNKPLIKKLGIDCAILLADLISKQEYFKEHNMLDRESFFFNEKDNIESDTSLSFYRQQKALEILLEEKLIETKKYGVPQKVYYKIDIDFVDNYITDLCHQTSSSLLV